MEQKQLQLDTLKLSSPASADGEQAHTLYEERQGKYREELEHLQKEIGELAAKIKESFADPSGTLYVKSEINAGTVITIGPESIKLKNRVPGCTVKSVEDIKMRIC